MRLTVCAKAESKSLSGKFGVLRRDVDQRGISGAEIRDL